MIDTDFEDSIFQIFGKEYQVGDMTDIQGFLVSPMNPRKKSISFDENYELLGQMMVDVDRLGLPIIMGTGRNKNSTFSETGLYVYDHTIAHELSLKYLQVAYVSFSEIVSIKYIDK